MKTYVICDQCGQTNKVETEPMKTPVCGACQTALPVHGALVTATDRSLAKLIAKSPLPVVVDVWAPWCGPCRAFAPTFEEASREFAGRYVFVKINSQDNPQWPSQLGVRGIPTLIVFRDGQEVTRVAGAMPANDFTNWLKGV
ncbi:MAG: thioredoxin TrxC [Bdellovibrionaceae bacterium]|nr:thioredoxin TrxC [Pseudobdellovibrionaceae bacterium]